MYDERVYQLSYDIGIEALEKNMNVETSYDDDELWCAKNKKMICKIGEIYIHKKNYILNLVNSNQIWIVNKLLRLIYHQTEFRLVLNKSEKCNYDPNLVWINTTPK